MNVKKLIIHHSLTKDGQVVDWNAIRRYHREVNGWNDIGYHWGIERAGNCYALQAGRPETVAGAHTKGMNEQSIGICIVGNYDQEKVPEEALALLVDLCLRKCRQYGLTPADIVTHHQYAVYKTCPGANFPMSDLQQRVAAGLGVDANLCQG